MICPHCGDEGPFHAAFSAGDEYEYFTCKECSTTFYVDEDGYLQVADY